MNGPGHWNVNREGEGQGAWNLHGITNFEEVEEEARWLARLHPDRVYVVSDHTYKILYKIAVSDKVVRNEREATYVKVVPETDTWLTASNEQLRKVFEEQESSKPHFEDIFTAFGAYLTRCGRCRTEEAFRKNRLHLIEELKTLGFDTDTIDWRDKT